MWKKFVFNFDFEHSINKLLICCKCKSFQDNWISYLRTLLRRHDVFRIFSLHLHASGPSIPRVPSLQEHHPPRPQAGKPDPRYVGTNRPTHRFRIGARDSSELLGELDRRENRSESRVFGAGSDFERTRRDVYRYVVFRSFALCFAQVKLINTVLFPNYSFCRFLLRILTENYF